MSEETRKDMETGQARGDQIRVGGNIGPGAAVGSGAHVEAGYIVGGNLTIGAAAANATRQDFLDLLQQLQTQLTQLQAQLDPSDAADAQDALAKATEMAQRDEPPTERIRRHLDSVREIVEDAAKTTTAVISLVPLAQKALAMFSHLFGG